MDTRPVILLDFDGTVCVGDGPVWAYADQVIAAIPPEVGAQLRLSLASMLDDSGVSRSASPASVDGYAAIAEFGAKYLEAVRLQECYLRSRQELASGTVECEAPVGLAGFLRSLAARLVLVTNAPAVGVEETLTVLGLNDVFDAVVTNAAKPAGMATIVSTELAGRGSSALMSIGDIWANDLAVPHEMGCVTGYIDRHRRGDGTPTWRSSNFIGLYDHIADWAADVIRSTTDTSV